MEEERRRRRNRGMKRRSKDAWTSEGEKQHMNGTKPEEEKMSESRLEGTGSEMKDFAAPSHRRLNDSRHALTVPPTGSL